MKITFVGNFGVDYSSETHHAKTLESLGHEVIRQQEGEVSARVIADNARNSDLLVWVHTHGWTTPNPTNIDILSTMKALNIPTMTYHLDLWLGIEREADLSSDPFYKDIGYFFTVDKLMADWFNENTEVKGRFMPAGVFDQEVYMAKPEPKYNVIFVGSRGYHKEWQYRPQLIDWLRDTYKERFTLVGGDGDIPTTRGHALNQLYADTKVVIGDTLCKNFDYPYYLSDRIFETTGRGGFLIHPIIKGLDRYFTKNEVVQYHFGEFDELKYLIDYYLENDLERETIRHAGFLRTKFNHTYKHRWQEILKEVFND